MAAPYSMDLRERVIEAVESGLSCNQAAIRFDVAISTAIGWVNRYRETGSFAPARIGGHRPKKLVGVWRDDQDERAASTRMRRGGRLSG